jgi:mRNA-degrading endonuclease RelE of RelBE toxin-antitoxin system
LLTLSKRWGHGLNCPPAEIYEVVGGINREHTIGVVDFDEWWPSPPLLKPHLARLVSALSEFAPKTNVEVEGVPLKVEEIGVRAGVHDRSMRYRLFRQLKAQEIITRNEKGYMVTDVDWDLVKKIVAALDKKIRVELITSEGAGFTNNIRQKRALLITSEVEFIYPDQSWRDLGIEVAGEVAGDTADDLVNLLGEILFTPLKQQLIPRGEQSFSAILPIVGDRLQSDFFAMLDFLGLGRAEILRLKEVASTITDAAFLIKETEDVVNNHLVDAVKAQIAMVLTRGGIAEVESDVSFREITDILEKRLGVERASFARAILRQQKAPLTEPLVRLRERLEQMTPIDLRMKPAEGVGQKRFTLVIPERAFDEYREEKEREKLWRAVTDYAQKGIGSDRHYYTDMAGPLSGGKLFSLRAGKFRILFEIAEKGEAYFITVFSRGDWNKVQKNYLA